MSLAERHLMSIGDALELLKPEFPDLTISKLRFLENEGLVEPQRTGSGYRKYSHADIQRLRYVLAMQRDQYLPLRVIKEHLEALDRGLNITDGTVRPLSLVNDLPDPEQFITSSVVRLNQSELLENAGADEGFFQTVIEFGLIESNKQFYSVEDVEIVKACLSLSEFGIEPRHLRQFRIAADREISLVEQVTNPIKRSKEPSADQVAQEKAREIAALCTALHIALVRTGLGKLL
jgi:DNA-binding transcriptional MerR regulator